jgi:hypothetical protein
MEDARQEIGPLAEKKIKGYVPDQHKDNAFQHTVIATLDDGHIGRNM